MNGVALVSRGVAARRRYAGPYRESGVEWIGALPVGWQTRRLKFVAPIRTDRLTEKPDDAAYVGLEHVESWTGRLLLDRQPEMVESTVARFEAGDVLFGKLRPYLAKVVRPGFDGVCSSELLVLHPTPDFTPSYLFYCLLTPSHIRWIDSMTYGTKMPRASPEQVGSSVVPLPSTAEQVAIAAFLDRETAKIDALVAKKERLIELLGKKRAALITRAVTKGVDPNVRMRGSGVEWLGSLPTHWGAAQLRRFVRFITSGSRAWAEHYTDDGAIFLRIGNLTRDSICLDLADLQHVDPPRGAERERTRVAVGDLLFSITAYLGSVAVADDAVAGAYINQHIALVRLGTSAVTPRFVAYVALSNVGQMQLAGSGYGGTKVQLALDDVRALWLPIPSLEEQERIVEYLDEQTGKIERVIATIATAIDRLREYRTALISAAVTGKIDVREEAA